MSELKPVRCGCGGEMLTETIGNPVFGWRLRCPKWHIMTSWFDSESEAVEAWNKAMGAVRKSRTTERTAKLEHTYQVGENWFCENCGQQLNAYDWEAPQNLAELGNENARVSEVTSQNDDGTWQKTERTVKVVEHDASVTDTDGYKYHRSEYLCDACKKKVIGGDEYCSHCGCRLEWE